MKLFIITIVYFLLPTKLIFAGAGHEDITVLSEADWIGPLIAVLIVVVAVVIAKRIKRSRLINNK